MMTKRTLASLILGLWCGGVGASRAEDTRAEIECAYRTARAAPVDASDHRKYAPSREMDILHLRIEVTPDFAQRTLRAQVELQFQPIALPLAELKLDAVGLQIQTVAATEPIRAWQTTPDKLLVTFANPIPPDHAARVTIHYRAEPTEGLYFRTPEMGYRPGDTHLFTQGEAIHARHWYPCFDAPNEKFTSEMVCHVPEGMIVLSNGRLLAETKNPSSGLVAFHWLQDKPHVNYLIALVAGYFLKLEEQDAAIPLTFYTPPSLFADAANSFRDTKDMLAFFEQEIGVPYPWAKYAQVCVNDFVAGGMENTSLTVLTDGTLFPNATENLRSSQGLVAHELVHQWFGDLVTCKDWTHLWLNEGFATYYEALYDGHKNGRDAFLYNLYRDAQTILGQPLDLRPIAWRNYDSPDQQFSYLAYPKGAWVLHMLRSQLGPDLYRRCIRTYLERHAYDTVVTEDLNAVLEELSGRSFDQFFDQWVYHAHYPELEIAYAWDEKTRLAKLTVKQIQTLSDKVLLFHFPLPVRFQGKSGAVTHQVTVKEKTEDFYFALPEAPTLVRVDPDFTVLAKTKLTLPHPLWLAQLDEPSDLLGRLGAVIELAKRKDKETVAKLKQVLNTDAFYGVRIEASKALRAIHTDDALDALLASTDQPDARVRRQVTADLTGFYRGSVSAALQAILEREQNPDILAEAIRGLAVYGAPDIRATLSRYLGSTSFRNVLAEAALRALRTLDDPAAIPAVLEVLDRREPEFTSNGFASGLGTLAHLARHEDDKGPVREFLLRRVNHPKLRVQLAALRALGDLGDPQALPVLETFAQAGKENPQRQTAERAVAAVRAARKPPEELRTLRDEVLGLQKENRELRRDLDDLKKRFEAVTPAPPPSSEKESAPRKKKK